MAATSAFGTTLDKAQAHHQAGDLDKAIALYRHALRGHPGDLRTRLLLGSALQSAGEWAQAEEMYRAATRLEPSPAPHSRRALAALLSGVGRTEESLAVWREGVEHAKDPAESAQARLGLMAHLSDLRRADEALGIAAALAAEQPTHIGAQYELGRLAERLGDDARARPALEAVTVGRPDLPEPHLLLARIDQRAGKGDAARQRLERVVLALKEDPRQGAACIELAAVLDRQGTHELAFEMARRGQMINFSTLPARAQDPRMHEHVLNLCQSQVTTEGVAGWARPTVGSGGSERPAPVFVVGFPRSGTTLLEQMLAAHPNLAVTDELPILQRVRENLYRAHRPTGVYPTDLGRFTAEQVTEARNAYFARAYASIGAAGAGKRLVDKQPLNTVDLCTVRLLFPESPVVFVQRDPRDTVLSCFMQGFSRGVPHLFHLDGTAHLYARVMDLWEHYKAVLGLKYVEVKYEDLVKDPAGQLRKVLETAGEPWSDAVLKHHEPARRRYVTTPSYADVGQPVYTRAVGRWKNYKVQLEPVLARLQPYVQRMGYAAE